MRNNSRDRVLFVPTVDGLSIMNGKEASFKSRGYIVNSYDSLVIDGWRTSDDKVSEFFFSSPKGSYASRMDQGGNLGVIGCVVFKDKEKVKVVKEYIPVPYPSYPQYPHYNYPNLYAGTGAITGTSNFGASLLNNVTCSSSQTASAGLGTGFGQDKYSPVVTVDFDKEDHPSAVFSIYYNTRKNLESMGVEFKKPVYIAPSAFPNEDSYCVRP